MNTADWKSIMNEIHEVKKNALKEHDMEIVLKMANIWRALNNFSIEEQERVFRYYNQIDKS